MTLAEARELLALWIAADKAVATGQEYSIGSRRLVRADAGIISKKIAYYESVVSGLASGRGSGVRMFRVMPSDL